MNASALVQKIWNFCNTLRDDGMSYGDYLEQLTFLIFIKMADEYANAQKHPTGSISQTHESSERDQHNKHDKHALALPEKYNWESLIVDHKVVLTGEPLAVHYAAILENLGQQEGILKAIFTQARNKIQDPAKLASLIRLIDSESWISLDFDTKGDLYEGLLQKNAEDVKGGAGQYFTPRPLIRAMVECVRPTLGKTIADPACGTGGFFLAAADFLKKQIHTDQAEQSATSSEQHWQNLRTKTFFGNEIVAATHRLCLMNLFLHGLGDLENEPNIKCADALTKQPEQQFDYVFANPPFGKKSSMTFSNEAGKAAKDQESLTYERQDFWETTANKQLNFLQHIVSVLKADGKAAVVLPDNVLFEGGAGEKIRRKLLQNCDVHTILRLPTGIFYANGVKANVVFFDAKPKGERVHTKGIWYYDLRTNQSFTLKTNSLKYEHLQDFIACYNPEDRSKRTETERFKYYPYETLIARDKASLDIFWLKDNSLDNIDNLPTPDILAQEIIEHLESALESFREVAAALPSFQPKPPRA